MVTGRYRAIAFAACIGMLFVLLAGALVTNTDSGRGCGDDWPLCHGKFIPAYTFETAIEMSHRLITAAEGLLVVAAFIPMLQRYRKDKKVYKEPYLYALGALAFTVIQALMGAAAVKWHQSDAVMAIHFGISLIAFAFTLLLVVWTYRVKRGIQKPIVVPSSIFPLTIGTAIYCYIVVYLGAYIRHTESAGGCVGWPLCNGEVVPELSGATGAVFIHRVAAALLGIVIIAQYYYIRKLSRGEAGLTRSAGWAVIIVLLQILSGAWLTFTIDNEDWFIFTSLLHNLVITGLFGLLADLVIRSWRLSEARIKR